MPRKGQCREGGRFCLVPLGAVSWHHSEILSCLSIVFVGTAFSWGAPRTGTHISGVPRVL